MLERVDRLHDLGVVVGGDDLGRAFTNDLPLLVTLDRDGLDQIFERDESHA